MQYNHNLNSYSQGSNLSKYKEYAKQRMQNNGIQADKNGQLNEQQVASIFDYSPGSSDREKFYLFGISNLVNPDYGKTKKISENQLAQIFYNIDHYGTPEGRGDGAVSFYEEVDYINAHNKEYTKSVVSASRLSSEEKQNLTKKIDQGSLGVSKDNNNIFDITGTNNTPLYSTYKATKLATNIDRMKEELKQNGLQDQQIQCAIDAYLQHANNTDVIPFYDGYNADNQSIKLSYSSCKKNNIGLDEKGNYDYDKDSFSSIDVYLVKPNGVEYGINSTKPEKLSEKTEYETPITVLASPADYGEQDPSKVPSLKSMANKLELLPEEKPQLFEQFFAQCNTNTYEDSKLIMQTISPIYQEVAKIYGLDTSQVKIEIIEDNQNAQNPGHYNFDSNKLTINKSTLYSLMELYREKGLSSDEASKKVAYTLLKVITHETFHAYQDQNINSDGPAKGSHERTNAWKVTYDHYLNSSDSIKLFGSPDPYKNQQIEADAYYMEEALLKKLKK